jgi:hypothetical protein
MRVVFALVALCAVAATLPASASAATYKGKTKQGRKAVVTTDADGLVNRVKVGWKATCADGTYTSRTIFMPPFDTSSSTEFADVGNYSAKPSGYVSAIRVSVHGTWVEETDRWRGTFSVRVQVRKDGKLVDTCRLKKLKWSAARA